MPEHTAEKDAGPTHPCDWCQMPMSRAALDDCVNPEHRASDSTLGIREAGCGCCVVVDRAALHLLRTSVIPPGTGGAS